MQDEIDRLVDENGNSKQQILVLQEQLRAARASKKEDGEAEGAAAAAAGDDARSLGEEVEKLQAAAACANTSYAEAHTQCLYEIGEGAQGISC